MLSSSSANKKKMSQKLWVQHQMDGRTYGPTRVTIDGCEYVDDFLKEIKKESQLAIPKDTAITLYNADENTEIDVGDSPADLVAGNSRKNALIVKTTAMLGPAARLTELLLHHTLYDAPTSLSSRNRAFKSKLKNFYDCYLGKQIRCMLLDTGFPPSLVIASHLFRRSNEFIAHELMQITDIDDVRNGLLLFKPLENAFDRFIISFIYDTPTDAFRLKVVNRNFLGALLVDELSEDDRNILFDSQVSKNWRTSSSPIFAPNSTFNILTTFGDLDNQTLVFKNLGRPFKRCLNLQARLARKMALEKKLTTPYDFEDFWSEGMSLREKLDLYFAEV